MDWKKGSGLGWCSSGLVEGKAGLWLGNEIGFVWACWRKGRAGEWDHLSTRSGFNQSPLPVVHLGLVGTRI